MIDFRFPAIAQAAWEQNAAESYNSYEPNSTWAQDLAIALLFDRTTGGKKAIQNTVDNAIKAWKDEPGHRYLIMLGCAINFMSWFCNAIPELDDPYTRIFSDLYYWYIDEMDKIDPAIYGMIHHYLD